MLLTTRLPAQKSPGYQPPSVQDQGSSPKFLDHGQLKLPPTRAGSETDSVAAPWASIAHMRERSARRCPTSQGVR